MSRLGVRRRVAVGVVELLHHFTSEFARPGDIGRFTDEAIAEGCDWDRADATHLVDSLVGAVWLDPCVPFRLVVHDWHEHADPYVRKSLQRAAVRSAGLSLSANIKWSQFKPQWAEPDQIVPAEKRRNWRDWLRNHPANLLTPTGEVTSHSDRPAVAVAVAVAPPQDVAGDPPQPPTRPRPAPPSQAVEEPPEALALARHLGALLERHVPGAQMPRSWKLWARPIRLIGRPWEEIRHRIDWLFSESNTEEALGHRPFVVQSGRALREKYGRVGLAMDRKRVARRPTRGAQIDSWASRR